MYEAIELLVDCSWIYRNLFLVSAFSLESDNAVCSGKQSIVSAASYVQAGVNLCAALSVQDIASKNELSICSLGA